MFNAGLMGAGGEPVVFGLAFAYGGLAQLLAGVWELRTGNTFGAVAFTSYGAFWLSFWAFEQFYAKHVSKADLGHAVGLYLIAWGIFTAYMFIASLRTTGAIALVFLLLTITFVLLGIGMRAPTRTSRSSADTSDWPRQRPRGTPRSRPSPTAPSAGSHTVAVSAA